MKTKSLSLAKIITNLLSLRNDHTMINNVPPKSLPNESRKISNMYWRVHRVCNRVRPLRNRMSEWERCKYAHQVHWIRPRVCRSMLRNSASYGHWWRTCRFVLSRMRWTVRCVRWRMRETCRAWHGTLPKMCRGLQTLRWRVQVNGRSKCLIEMPQR